MATIKVTQAHSLSIEDAKKRVEQSLSSYASKFGLKHRWEGDKLVVSGSGVDGHINVTNKSADAELKLGLAASMFKGQVESGLKTELEKNLKG